MPIDPYAALNAMIRAEVTRFTPPPRTKPEPKPASEPEEAAVRETTGRETAALSRNGSPVQAASAD
ncbi:hypothetical protein ACFV7Q_25755 [Streptomyces sp. NPDC059851]|uniref:hypothetical protein n=1 Tax=Streptomyces sp. NPDC059851 TaxID=3346971 RepID=UPI0036560732